MKKSTPSYMQPKGVAQSKDEGLRRTAPKPTGHLAASPADPVLERSFRGHKDTISSVGFNPNLYIVPIV